MGRRYRWPYHARRWHGQPRHHLGPGGSTPPSAADQRVHQRTPPPTPPKACRQPFVTCRLDLHGSPPATPGTAAQPGGLSPADGSWTARTAPPQLRARPVGGRGDGLGAGCGRGRPTVVAVALPAIGRNLHVGIQGLQWTVTNYTVPLAAVTKKVAVRAEAVSNTVSRRVTQEEDLPAAVVASLQAASQVTRWARPQGAPPAPGSGRSRQTGPGRSAHAAHHRSHITHHSAVTIRDRRPIMASARYRLMCRDEVCVTNSMNCSMRRLCARAKISVDHSVWRPLAKSADPSRV